MINHSQKECLRGRSTSEPFLGDIFASCNVNSRTKSVYRFRVDEFILRAPPGTTDARLPATRQAASCSTKLISPQILTGTFPDAKLCMRPNLSHRGDIRQASLDHRPLLRCHRSSHDLLPRSLILHHRDRKGVMSAAVFFGLRALSQTLTAQEALSGVFGSISLATWIFLLVSISWADAEF